MVALQNRRPLLSLKFGKPSPRFLPRSQKRNVSENQNWMAEMANQLFRTPNSNGYPTDIIIVTLTNHWDISIHSFADSDTTLSIRHHVSNRI